MTEREALKLALEALEAHADIGIKSDKAITAIEEALMSVPDGAQPEQEPVALPCCGYTDASAIKWNPYNQVVQCHNCGQVYTTPPQRPSRSDIKPLTDEEIILIVAECASSHQHTDIHFARAIERAHGIKELV